MDSRNRQVGLAPLLVGFVVLLVVIYVGALGPIVWLDRTGWIEFGPDSTVARLYWPVSVAAQNPLIGRILRWYVEMWDPNS